MRSASLFLNGRYYTRHFSFYRQLCKGSFKVAVDGGYRFFPRANIVPDLLIGDFDSVGVSLSSINKRTSVIEHPVNKDKTDSHLALEECLKRKFRSIDLVQPNVGEPDHFLGNLMLLDLARRMSGYTVKSKVRLVGPRLEAQLVADGQVTLFGKKGWRVSVVPLTERIVLTIRGTKWQVEGRRIARGDSLSLRNEIVSQRSDFSVEGEAFVVATKIFGQ